MEQQGIRYEVIDRRTYTKSGPFRKYLDYGWICKYRISKAACIDLTLKNETGYDTRNAIHWPRAILAE